MTLGHLFDLSLRGRAAEPGLEWNGRTYRFGDIADRAARMTGVLRDRGIRRGDRVAVYLPNGLTLIDLYLACARLGAIFVPINILYRERELGHILRDAEPSALVAQRGSLPDLDASPPTWWADDLDTAASARRADHDHAVLDPDTPAMLVYTSGTTGRAKGAVLTHGNLVANAAALILAWQITDRDRLLLALPLFHVHGLGNGLHCWLGSGCRLRLLERFEHSTIAGEFTHFVPTVFFGVPTMYSRLLDVPAGTARSIGAAARLFVSGSAALAPHVFDAFRDRFGHAILERYGMSETLMTLSNPCVGERRAGTVGVPLPGVSARVRNDAGQDLPDDEVGELWVRGPTVFAGYWRNEEATRQAFDGPYFRTGDLASRGGDGVFTLHGRRGDLIISGGFNIYPREIEQVLEEHPAIAEAAVVGTADDRRGEVPVAYIVCRGTPSETLETDLETHCRQKLASFKLPRRFVIVGHLPRNALGKIQKGLITRDAASPNP
jgi:malonyl-CoA/methylmalonyl-CoA synthetase